MGGVGGKKKEAFRFWVKIGGFWFKLTKKRLRFATRRSGVVGEGRARGLWGEGRG